MYAKEPAKRAFERLTGIGRPSRQEAAALIRERKAWPSRFFDDGSAGTICLSAKWSTVVLTAILFFRPPGLHGPAPRNAFLASPKMRLNGLIKLGEQP